MAMALVCPLRAIRRSPASFKHSFPELARSSSRRKALVQPPQAEGDTSGRSAGFRPSGKAVESTKGTKSPERTSFGSVGSVVGLALLSSGFWEYFLPDKAPGSGASSLLLIYGFLLFVLGLAFKYAELPPLECYTYEGAPERRSEATPTQKQIKADVTRFRYGEEVHLEEALNRIFRLNERGGLRPRDAPILDGLREQVLDGGYALVLEFQSRRVPLEDWEKRKEYIESFFGPGVRALLDQPEEGRVDLALVSQGTGDQGQVADDDTEVLPPLMPGLPSRIRKKTGK